MLALVVLVATLVAVVAIALVVQEVRRRRPPELRGNWWTAFEREFRAYAREVERSRRTRSHRRDQPGQAR